MQNGPPSPLSPSLSLSLSFPQTFTIFIVSRFLYPKTTFLLPLPSLAFSLSFYYSIYPRSSHLCLCSLTFFLSLQIQRLCLQVKIVRKKGEKKSFSIVSLDFAVFCCTLLLYIRPWNSNHHHI